METFMEIIRVLLPLLIVGAIVVFVVYRLKSKYNNGTLGRKDSQQEQSLLDSLIPLGMLFGCAIGTVVSLFVPVSMLTGVSLGAAIGYLAGYIVYEYSSKNRKSHS